MDFYRGDGFPPRGMIATLQMVTVKKRPSLSRGAGQGEQTLLVTLFGSMCGIDRFLTNKLLLIFLFFAYLLIFYAEP
jgi:hypothetical protein